MRYNSCPYCGTVNDAGNVYCEGCGRIIDNGNSACMDQMYSYNRTNMMGASPVMVRKSGNKTMKIIIIVAAAIIMLVASGAFVYAHFFSEKTVDITSGFDDKVLNVTGYNGEGQIVEFDEGKARQLQRYNDADKDVKELLDSVEYTTDRDADVHLKNGDKVRITADYDEEFAKEKNIKVVGADGGKVEETIKIENRFPEKKEEPEENESSENYDSGYNTGFDNGYDSGFTSGYNSANNDSGYNTANNNSSYNSDSSYNSGGSYGYNQNSGQDEQYDETEGDEAYNTVSEVWLTDDDVSDFSYDKAQRWINYIYAKNGYRFQKDKEEKAYFEQFSWYNNMTYTTRSQSTAESRFNDTETHNNKVLAKRRNALK